DGGTALLAASQYGHMKVVETLLKHGANIHDQLYDGATALFLAAQGGYLDVIRLLLSSGAKVNQPRQKSRVDRQRAPRGLGRVSISPGRLQGMVISDWELEKGSDTARAPEQDRRILRAS
ncbi:Ankyrin repeat domain-containing protein 29, partial [Eschrichtius robustus]|nr:Ankyrin repeat domain-containing protein 29 [Eschrichtius robustus]